MSLHAQLRIGEEIPDLAFKVSYKNSLSGKSTGSYKGKVLILNFMGVNCASCIEALPGLNKLQSQMKDSLQIVTVVKNQPEVLKALLLRLDLYRLDGVKYTTDYKKIDPLFAHEFTPFVVWIGPDGTIKAMTDDDYVTPDNVRKVFSNVIPDWPVEGAYTLSKDAAKELLTRFDLQKNEQLTFFSKYRPLVWPFADTIKNLKGMDYHILSNWGIIEMYKYGCRLMGIKDENRMILKLVDSVKFFQPKNEFRAAWDLEHRFFYMTSFVDSVSNVARGAKMINDFNAYYNLHGRVFEKDIQCWVISRDSFRNDHRNTPATEIGLKQFESLKSLTAMLNMVSANTPVLLDYRCVDDQALWIPRELLKDIAALSDWIKKDGISINSQVRKITCFELKE